MIEELEFQDVKIPKTVAEKVNKLNNKKLNKLFINLIADKVKYAGESGTLHYIDIVIEE